MKYVNYESFTNDDDSYLLDAQNKWEAFEKAKDRLPDELIALYNQNEIFDGMKIYSIDVDKMAKNKEKTAQLEVGHGPRAPRCIFKYYGIDKIAYDLDEDASNKTQDHIAVCLLDELYKEDEYLCHNIMLSDGKEVNIRCRRMSVETISKP